MSRATVTPLQALNRLIEACKLVDFKDCTDLYNQFQGELAVAEMVVRDWVEPVAAQPAVVAAPEGWKLVPVKATPKMIDATWDMVIGGVSENTRNRVIWNAMLAAAPAIAAPVEVERDALKANDVQWIVNDNAELGVKIGNQFFFLYKGGSLVYESGTHDDGSAMMYRPVFKREFGECAHPINYNDYSKIGTVSISDSDEWKPIGAAIATGDKHE